MLLLITSAHTHSLLVRPQIVGVGLGRIPDHSPQQVRVVARRTHPPGSGRDGRKAMAEGCNGERGTPCCRSLRFADVSSSRLLCCRTSATSFWEFSYRPVTLAHNGAGRQAREEGFQTDPGGLQETPKTHLNKKRSKRHRGTLPPFSSRISISFSSVCKFPFSCSLHIPPSVLSSFLLALFLIYFSFCTFSMTLDASVA